MPITVPHTSRQRITTRSGVALERAYVFMPAEVWNALQSLCVAQHRSGSQVIEHLINNAISGNQTKDNINECTNTAHR
jgi:hypothetical protein